MLKRNYRFVIEILTPAAVSLGQFDISVDWEPARQCLRLLRLRRGLADAAAGERTISIEPVWDGEGPYAAGVCLTDGEVRCEIEKAYFKPLAVEISTALVEKHVLKPGDLYIFRILAYREAQELEQRWDEGFTIRDATPRISFVEAPLDTLAGAVVECPDRERSDVPVFIPQSVLDEVEALTREAGSRETGGILIGRLHRDAALPEIAVVVTAQIPARHTLSKATSLTFTAETWTAVQAALDLRRSGELMVGWYHSHPSFAFCDAHCPQERRRTCALQKPFLSGDDLLLHRAVFPKAWQVALLANNADAGLEFALYGWRRGLIRRRGFVIHGAVRRADHREPDPLNQPSTGDMGHANPRQE